MEPVLNSSQGRHEHLISLVQIQEELVPLESQQLKTFVEHLLKDRTSAIVLLNTDSRSNLEGPAFFYWPLEKTGNGFRVVQTGQITELEVARDLKQAFQSAFVADPEKRQFVEDGKGGYGVFQPKLRSVGETFADLDVNRLVIPVEGRIVDFLMSCSQDFPTPLLVDKFEAYRFDPDSDNGAGVNEDFLRAIFGRESDSAEVKLPRVRDRWRSVEEAAETVYPISIPPDLLESFEIVIPLAHGSVELSGIWNGEIRRLGRLTRIY